MRDIRMPTLAIAASLLCCAPVSAAAQAQEPYRHPRSDIAAIAAGHSTLALQLSPDKRWTLFLARPSLDAIEELSYPRAHLAGIVIDTRANARGDAVKYTGASLARVRDAYQVQLRGLPEGSRLLQARWSPDASRIALLVQAGDKVTLWMAGPGEPGARQVHGAGVNAVFDEPCEWLPDSSALLCRFVLPGRGAVPAPPAVPVGPIVRGGGEERTPARTHAGLLKPPFDEALFEHYATSRLGKISLDGKLTWLPVQGVISEMRLSPDGRYMLTQTRHRPYSYALPFDYFPNRVEIRGLAGNLVRVLADVPLDASTSIDNDAITASPRGFGWRSDAPASVFWAQAQDGGDPSRVALVRDRAYLWAAPFDGKPVVLGDFGYRLGEMHWARGDLALAVEYWWKTQRANVWRLRPDRAGAGPELVLSYSSEDRYAHPGSPLVASNSSGRDVLETDGESIFLVSPGASAEGDRPRLARFDLESKASKPVWESRPPHFEWPAGVLRDGQLLVRRESSTEPPNWHVQPLAGPGSRALTEVRGPALPEIETKQLRYRRTDGVALSATLYLPPRHDASKGLPPVVLVAYPHEFRSAAAAGQVRGSPHQYRARFLGSPLVYALQGYAVIDRAAMPIVAAGGKEPNDTYVEQLIMNAKAALEEVGRIGASDPRRAAVAGHSYGASMVANLLAHSDLFCAGIAMSGAYNRTLTPFGFQAEDRDLWRAKSTYLAISPLLHAEQVNAPLLLVHGEDDPNPGVPPMQSERMFDALKGLGKRARLVVLPKEGHGYRARESVMHVLAEQSDWLEAWVRSGKGCGAGHGS